MKRSRFSEEQITGILKDAGDRSDDGRCLSRLGVSSATFYKRKAKYGCLDVSEARRLKALEDENARLKKLPAESMLSETALRELLGRKKKMVEPAAKREAVARPRHDFEMSERRTLRKTIGRRRERRSWWKPPPPLPEGSLDFEHGQLSNGRRFRGLNIVDDVTRERLAVSV